MDELAIFTHALDLETTQEREAYLQQACGENQPLRARLDALLKSNRVAGSFLQGSPPGLCATEEPVRIQAPGETIGPYKLLELIGEGGMGLVYMAQQTEPVKRKVALKVIKPGMDSRQVIARFAAERQALAMMDHPNIAKIFEAGTVGEPREQGTGNREQGELNEKSPSFPVPRSLSPSAGRPYFVMELVRGVPITEYCQSQRLNTASRLKLFLDVCGAVQHAHQKGIIHRDLKPSNVLITLHDGVPVVKVIDFGVAKALNQELTERTLFTQYSQMIGTPLYMSPEQAELSGLDIDTRSDVYSLGVLLYELLTGTTPFDKERLKSVTFDELRRIIREEEPETVSARIAKTRRVGSAHQTPLPRGEGGRRPGEGVQQSTSPATSHQHLATRFSELDWIAMKALEKDRTRRYESASALAADIQRYLSDEPVHAYPPTAMYRFQKFARKHKPAFITAAAVALCLVLGTTVSAWQAVRATTAEAQANANATQAQAKAQEATEQRDEAQKQRDEVKELNAKLLATQAELRATLYATHMRIAQDAWEGGGIERVQEVLAQTRPKPSETDLRGFEWHYLYRLSHGELLTVQRQSDQWDYHRMAFSPDGRRLAAGGGTYDKATKTYVSGEVKVWDAQTGQELRTFKGHTGYVVSLAFSADSKRVASGSGSFSNTTKPGQLKVWDVETGEELVSLKGHTGSVGSVAFSPDGKRVASASGSFSNTPRPGELKVWDAQTGEELVNLKGHTDRVTSVVFSPDGNRLASTSSRLVSELKLWDVLTGRELLTLKSGTPMNGSGGIAFSPDGKRLAGSADDETVKVWDSETGQELLAVKGQSPLGNMVFSPDGQRLAISSGTNIKVWNAQTGQEIGTLLGHTQAVRSIAFAPDSLRLLSAAGDGTIKVWDAQTRQTPLILKGHKGGLIRVAFSPDGKRLVSAGGDMKLWNLQPAKEIFTLQGHIGPVYGVAFSPDGKLLASSSPDKRVKVWDAQSGRELRTFAGTTSQLWSVSFSPDGQRLAFPDDKTLKVCNVKTGEELLSFQHESEVWYVAFSPDGKLLASAAGDKNVRLWDAESGKLLLTMSGHTADLEQVVFSPDGNRLASACDDRMVKVWDAKTGQELLSLKHIGALWDVAFSPDGKRLATGSEGVENGELKVWNAETGQELLTFKGQKYFSGIAFSPDGHWLAAGTDDKRVILYDATPLPEKP